MQLQMADETEKHPLLAKAEKLNEAMRKANIVKAAREASVSKCESAVVQARIQLETIERHIIPLQEKVFIANKAWEECNLKTFTRDKVLPLLDSYLTEMWKAKTAAGKFAIQEKYDKMGLPHSLVEELLAEEIEKEGQ